MKELMGDGGRSLFFLILAFGCAWTILDLFYGNKLLLKLVNAIFDSDDSATEPVLNDEELDKKKKGIATGK